MGCMMVKQGPVSQRDYGDPVIRPVFLPSEIGNEAKSAKKGQRPDDAHKSNAYAANKKIARYTAKFDPRVTAKYDLKALIGKGSFSRVVRVEHKVTREPYAVKVVDRRRGKDLYRSELNILLRVQHPYVIHLVEVFESKDKLYLVVDLATGGELIDRIIAKGSFTEQDACHVLKMVIEGLRYLHSIGITHRDLKPENILYRHQGPDSKILITDFGLSAFRKKGDEFMYTICGTPEYIAPEIVAKQPYTSQVDMWAVGVISYIMLSGIMPFVDENRARLYNLILEGQYSFDGKYWNNISWNAKNFITGLLTVDPTVRMTAIDALKHPWLTTPTPSNKDLQSTTSKNVTEQRSTRISDKGAPSVQLTKSGHSLHADHRRVIPEEVKELHPDTHFERSSLVRGITKSVRSRFPIHLFCQIVYIIMDM